MRCRQLRVAVQAIGSPLRQTIERKVGKRLRRLHDNVEPVFAVSRRHRREPISGGKRNTLVEGSFQGLFEAVPAATLVDHVFQNSNVSATHSIREFLRGETSQDLQRFPQRRNLESPIWWQS